MKVKKIDIVKLPFDMKTNHPILARLIILSKVHKLICFAKIQPTINGESIGKSFYRLYIPKIRVMNGSDSE